MIRSTQIVVLFLGVLVGSSFLASNEDRIKIAMEVFDKEIDAQIERDRRKFQLWNSCKPVGFYTETKNERATESIGFTQLTEDRITSDVNTQLSESGLYDSVSEYPNTILALELQTTKT